MIHKRLCNLSTKVYRTFDGIVKIPVTIMKNVNIFTIYETLFENVITILSISYKNKTKIHGKRKVSALLIYKKCQGISTLQAISV